MPSQKGAARAAPESRDGGGDRDHLSGRRYGTCRGAGGSPEAAGGAPRPGGGGNSSRQAPGCKRRKRGRIYGVFDRQPLELKELGSWGQPCPKTLPGSLPPAWRWGPLGGARSGPRAVPPCWSTPRGLFCRCSFKIYSFYSFFYRRRTRFLAYSREHPSNSPGSPLADNNFPKSTCRLTLVTPLSSPFRLGIFIFFGLLPP